jgi:hypothetical protein
VGNDHKIGHSFQASRRDSHYPRLSGRAGASLIREEVRAANQGLLILQDSNTT